MAMGSISSRFLGQVTQLVARDLLDGEEHGRHGDEGR
jgi:hypothetical protein